MNELIEYLEANLLDFEQVSKNVVKIADKTYQLVEPNEEGFLLDESLEMLCDDTDEDNYVFNFGDIWYWTPKGTEIKPQFNKLKHLGKAKVSLDPIPWLGVRGKYEILNGSRDYKDWCKKAKFLGITTLGICEKNTLAGTLQFQEECKANNIKSIIGATYTVFDQKHDYRFDVKLYAKNYDGWQAILGVNKAVLVDNDKFILIDQFKALDTSNLYVVVDPKSIEFEKIDFSFDFYQYDSVEYVTEQRDLWYLENLKKFILSKYKPILIQDSFYLDKDDAHIKPKLNSISGVRDYSSNNQYFKSFDEIFDEFDQLFDPEDSKFEKLLEDAKTNLITVSNTCDFTIETGNRHLPKYKMNEEESKRFKTNRDLFDYLIEEGFKKRVPKGKEKEYRERLNIEIEVIEYGDVIDYFLILWDIIKWCKTQKILVGIGRGSAGGALTSYLLEIIQLDPIQYDLLFERFLNKGRVEKSMPDIDTDFEGVRRNEVKRYMEQKYGEFQVCSVGTYTTLKAKAILKDFGKQDGGSIGEIEYINKIIDDDSKFDDLFCIGAEREQVKRFLKSHTPAVNDIPLVFKQPRASSVHACATLILPEDKSVFQFCPVKRMKLADGQDVLVTEWEGAELEKAGFLKEDILGVLQLDKFRNCLDLIESENNSTVDIYNLPLDDKKVYQYFQKGWNGDVFHFGSNGLTGYCKELKPEDINDLIAGISLYRPGAMENNFHNEYILRKEGKRKVEYFTGAQSILDKTYGVFVYQEQIMKLCQVLGGLSLVEADDVRKAMVKKKYEELTKYKVRFLPYYVDNFKVTEDYANNVWDSIDKASTYLFNKCISGDEKLKSTSVPYKYTIGELWKMRNIKGFYKTLGISTRNNPYKKPYGYSQSLCNDGKLRKNKIKDIRYEGIKEIYRITLVNGSSIDVTLNHNFPTNNGKKMVCDLKIGEDKLYYNIGYINDWVGESFTDKGLNYDKENNYSYKYELNSEKGKEGFQKKNTEYSKLKYYKMNLKKEYCEICYNDHNRLEVHHKDGNHINNNCDNLITVCPSCHKKEHYKIGRVKQSEKGLYTELVDIKSIEFIKNDEVYDVEMESPNHTFTTSNNIITSNSHATAYALTGYICQWLKVHYPIYYWVTAFSFVPEGKKDEKIPAYISEIHQTGDIKLKPVDINKSTLGFMADFKTNSIYWSLNSVKQCGEKAVEQIVSDKAEKGEYFDFKEFLSRNVHKGSKVTKQVIEHLVISGAFDELEHIDQSKQRFELIQQYRKHAKTKVDAEKDIFTNNDAIEFNWWWNMMQKRLSGFALFNFDLICEQFLESSFHYEDNLPESEGEMIKTAGYINEIVVRTSKKGEYADVILDNNFEFIPVKFWYEQWKQVKDLVENKEKCILCITGKVQFDKYKEKHIVVANSDSEILILE